jgi:hypothetical protein
MDDALGEMSLKDLAAEAAPATNTASHTVARGA